MEPTTKKQLGVNLTQSSLTRYEASFSFELALGRGAIVDVTTWTSSDFGVGRAGATIRVGLTTNLWNALVRSCVNDGQTEVLEGDDSELLSLAKAALERAKRMGEAAANFYALLDRSNGQLEAQQLVRVEYQQEENGNGYVVIGFPEDVAEL